jgi:hypothetical protein
MFDVFRDIMVANSYTYYVVVLLSLWAAMIIRVISDTTSLAVLMAPFIAYGALAGVYFCREFGLVFIYDNDSNIVACAAAGMCVAMLVMLGFCRLSIALADSKKTGLESRIDPTLTGDGHIHRGPLGR